eukprot:SAG31_NODE_1668_length_7576_cov_1.630467_5_plen_275_part_00
MAEDYEDRHGSFLSHRGQWYYFTNDRSHSKDIVSSAFRDTVGCCKYNNARIFSAELLLLVLTFISQRLSKFRWSLADIHFRANGTMEPCVIDTQGVNSHDLSRKGIEAENFFSLSLMDGIASGGYAEKVDLLDAGGGDGFAVGVSHVRSTAPELRTGTPPNIHCMYVNAMCLQGAVLRYPHLSNMDGEMAVRAAAICDGRLEFHAHFEGRRRGPLLASCSVYSTGGLAQFDDFRCPLTSAAQNCSVVVDLVVTVLRDDKKNSSEFLRLDRLWIV